MKKLFFILMLLANFAYAEVLIVASTEVDKKDAIAIFRLESFVFKNGERVKMILPPQDSMATKELLYTLGFTPTRWYERVEEAFSTGRLNKLKILDTEKKVSEEVLNNNGSIGYASHYYIYSVPVTIIKLRE